MLVDRDSIQKKLFDFCVEIQCRGLGEGYKCAKLCPLNQTKQFVSGLTCCYDVNINTAFTPVTHIKRGKSKRTCTNCGALIPIATKICPKCGVKD